MEETAPLPENVQVLQFGVHLNNFKSLLCTYSSCRHHLQDSESRLISRCFSMWRQLTTLTLEEAAHLFSTKLQCALGSDPFTTKGSGDMNASSASFALGLTCDSLDVEESSPRHSSSSRVVCSPSDVTTGALGRLDHLRVLSRQIEQSLQLSSCSRDNTVSLKRTSNPVRRLFVENEYSPSSEHTSLSVCPGNIPPSQSSIQLCGCLEPQVAHKIHEFRQRMVDSLRDTFHSCVDTAHCDCTDIVYPQHTSSTSHEKESNQTNPLQYSATPSKFISSANHSPPVSSTSITPSMSANYNQFDTPVISPKLVHFATCCIRNMQLYPCNRAFYKWLALTRKNISLHQRSTYVVKLFTLRRKKKIFETWRENYAKGLALKSLEKQHQDRVCLHITRSRFLLWRQQVDRNSRHRKLEAKAITYERMRCLRRTLSLWKKYHRSVTEEKSVMV